MSVSVSLDLPDQPAAGGVTYTPLGGDGWTSPHSVFEVTVNSAGDVSGGNNDIDVDFDPRFQSVVTYAAIRNSSASVAIEMRMTLLPALPRSSPQLQAFCNAVPPNAIDATNLMTWCPPPIPHFTRLQARTINADGDSLSLFMYIYNFQITVLQQVPLASILASLPRAESVIPFTAS